MDYFRENVLVALDMEKIATIDIGSNAVRFTVAELRSKDHIHILEKIRVPLRLGSESFGDDQQFSNGFIKYAQITFSEISKTLKLMNVTRLRTVATSAFRDAENSDELKTAIFNSSGIEVQPISGDEEASLILRGIQSSINFKKNTDYLLLDLGGGSLEISIIKKGEIIGSKSFNLGTVRLLELNKKVKGHKEIETWIDNKIQKIHNFIDKNIQNSKNLVVIGTGGNFRRLVKLRTSILGKKPRFVTPHEAQLILEVLEKTTYIERIQRYDLRPDRADVIIPALKVITKVIQNIPVNKVYAPSIGLDQGVLIEMSYGKSKADQIL